MIRDMSGSTLSGRPLRATTPDASLYIPRPHVEVRLQRVLDRGLNTLVIGGRGSGKTTLLQRALFGAREKAASPEDVAAVYVDAAPAETPLDAIERVAEELGIVRHAGQLMAAELQRVAVPAPSRRGETGGLLDLVRRLESVRAHTILLDGLRRGQIAHTLFGRFRDELWALPHTWVVAVDPDLRSQVLTPPADAFFESVLELEPFSVDAQVALLRARLDDDDLAVARRLVGPDYGNPRRLLAATRESLVNGRSTTDVLADRERRERIAAGLSRSAGMMLAELEDLDRPVSASDEDLLNRLGLRRERATQVLNQLEGAGLVESFSEPRGPGRPRKLYRVVNLPEESHHERPTT